MFLNKHVYQLWIAAGVSLCCLTTTKLSQAQITSDGTLSTKVTTSDNLNFTVTDGSQAEGNLFHSFDEFSVPKQGLVLFNNAPGVKNIISRVTGGSISNVDGLIEAKGSANLFLINPQGIIFGADAQLKIGGSFLASTANQLKFADGTFFSATDTQAQPLLTVSLPTGLQFGQATGRIVNRSGFLKLQPNKTLALVGSGVFIRGGGVLFAPGGRVELGSVAGPSIVSLTPITAGWALQYEGVQNFQNLQLSQAIVGTESESLVGDIQLLGREIAVTNHSQVGGFNFGMNPSGPIEIKASESVEVSGGSQLFNGTFSLGAGGEIAIKTRQLIVRDGAAIDALSYGDGRGGNITVDASESLEVSGNGLLTQITTQAFAGGNAGNVKVTTGRLILRDGGQISSSTTDTGNGGSVILDASESVEASGQGENFDGKVVNSGLFAETTGKFATGNGGLLIIDTERLVVQGGASISVAAKDGSTGQAGTLDINASDSVEVSGIGSALLTESNSPKPAGDLTISTDKLLVRDRAAITASSGGTGEAGNLQIQAGSIFLDNQGKLTATSTLGTGGGNIRLQDLNLLLLRGNSEISTSAGGNGNGGNINIDTDLLVGLENSDIIATAVRGRGGNIQINTQGIFGIEPRSERTSKSDITASSELGIDGVVEINRPEIEPSRGLVDLPVELVDVSGLIAQGCSAGGGTVAKAGEFIITGRGGLPPTPTEALRSDPALADLGTLVEGEENLASASTSNNQSNSEPTPLVEAQGWVISSKGEVMLTAQAPTVTPHIPWLQTHNCNAS